LDGLQDIPDLSGLTSLESLEIDNCYNLTALPAGIFQLRALKQLTIAGLDALQEMPDASGLTSLESLGIYWCGELTALPAGLFQLRALKNLALTGLPQLHEMPDPSGLTSLESLGIQNWRELRALPAGLFQLRALKQLTIRELRNLPEIPDALGRMTALERLTIAACEKLRALPASILHLSRLQRLEILCPLQDMPCIEALTALRNLDLHVYHTPGSRAFQALSRSLPCLRQLDALSLGCWITDQTSDAAGIRWKRRVAPRAEEVLALGRALRAWPLPLLLDVQDDYEFDAAQRGIRLSTCWQALGLPTAAADWSNATTLEFFRMQQHKVAAFASGMHARLGAASGVSRLDEQTLVMIADEVLGGLGLLQEWRKQERTGEGSGSASRKPVGL